MACLDLQVQWVILDHQDPQDSQAHLDLRATEEDLDPREQWVSKAHVETTDNLDHLDSLEAQEPLDKMGLQERKELGVILVRQVKLDFQVPEVLQD